MKKAVIISIVAASSLFSGQFYLNGKKVELEKPVIQTRSINNNVSYYNLGDKKVGVTKRILLKFKGNQDITSVAQSYNIKYIRSLKNIHVFEADSPESAISISKKLVEDGVVKYANPEFERKIIRHDLGLIKTVEKPSIKTNYISIDSISGIESDGTINTNKYYDEIFLYGDAYWWQIHNRGGQTVYVYNSTNNSFDTATSVIDVDNNVIEAWEKGYSGNGVRVGIIDDNFQMDHPDLEYVFTYNVSNGSRNVNPISWNVESHGTGVASVIAGKAQNGYSISGIAPNVDLVAVNGLFEVSSDVLTEAYIEAFQVMKDQNVRVVNCSFETTGVVNDALIDTMMDLTYNGGNGKGTLIVYASGNSGIDVPNEESQIPYVVSVGSVDGTGVRTSYSNYGSYLDFVAPTHIAVLDLQGDHDSDGVDDGVVTDSIVLQAGTSFSAPIVTGLAALIIEANPDLTRDQLLEIMISNSKKINSSTYTYNIDLTNNKNQYGDTYSWNNEMGYGMVDVSAAIDEAVTLIPNVYTQSDIDNAIISTIESCQNDPESCGITPLTQIVTADFVNSLPVGWTNVGNSVPLLQSDWSTIFANTQLIYVYVNDTWYAWSPDSTTQTNIINSTTVNNLEDISTIPNNSGIWILK